MTISSRTNMVESTSVTIFTLPSVMKLTTSYLLSLMRARAGAAIALEFSFSPSLS